MAGTIFIALLVPPPGGGMAVCSENGYGFTPSPYPLTPKGEREFGRHYFPPFDGVPPAEAWSSVLK